MLKKLLKYLIFLFVGLLGGMLWQTVALPYLAEQPSTNDWWFVQNYRQGKVILYPKEEKIIEENEAIVEMIEQVEDSVFGVELEGSKFTSSGLVLTNDGVAVTLAENIPTGSSASYWTKEESLEGEIQKRDLERNLLLIKLEEEGLKSAGFASLDDLKKGERVFLVGVEFHEGDPSWVVNEGVVKNFDQDFIYTNMRESDVLDGSVLFDIQGRVLGINSVGMEGEVISIPISKVREFAEL